MFMLNKLFEDDIVRSILSSLHTCVKVPGILSSLHTCVKVPGMLSSLHTCVKVPGITYIPVYKGTGRNRSQITR